MKVLLATDAFPPVSGGSGWSTYELARGLRTRGHAVVIVRPRPGQAGRITTTAYDGFEIVEVGAAAPAIPYVRNYFKNERLWARLADVLAGIVAGERIDVVHGQHLLTCLPSIEAAHRQGVPAVCTVRDYWPVCYWSDLIHTRAEGALCPGCSAGMMTRCIRPRAGAAWPAAVPMIPYMRRNLRTRREGLARADAVVAVSAAIAADLRTRAPEVPPGRVHVIPNPVDVAGLQARQPHIPRPLAEPYVLYAGKLAPNKGTRHLAEVADRAAIPWPLVVVGDGPDRPELEAAARRSSRDIRFTGWQDQANVTAWLAHAEVLVFPSRGPESLSRVLIEASALGIPIAAMRTGGTPDIVEHGLTGLLSETPDQLAGDLRRLIDDPALRARLGSAARERAGRFDAPRVVERIVALYHGLGGPAGR